MQEMLRLMIILKVTYKKFNPKLYIKGRSCVLWDGISIYENYIFLNFWKLHVAYVLTKTCTKRCYLGATLGAGTCNTV